MKVENRQQAVAGSKHRIKHLRCELREEEAILRRDLQRLRKEKMNGQSKTDSDAAYKSNIYGANIVNLDHLKDLLTDIPLDVAGDLLLWSCTNDTYTLAQVKLRRDDVYTTGIGITKRSPTDPINTTAGTRIAVRRALDDWLRKQA